MRGRSGGARFDVHSRRMGLHVDIMRLEWFGEEDALGMGFEGMAGER